MGLVRTALIFGVGYALGRPEGQAKVVELAKRPEVAQARHQAATAVSRGRRLPSFPPLPSTRPSN